MAVSPGRPLDVSCWQVISSFAWAVQLRRGVGGSGRAEGRSNVESVSDISVIDSNGLEDLFSRKYGVRARGVDVEGSYGYPGGVARVVG